MQINTLKDESQMRETLEEAAAHAITAAEHLPAYSEKWICICGHQSTVALPGRKAVDMSDPDARVIGVLVFYEGGVDFLARNGDDVSTERWALAEVKFLETLKAWEISVD